MEEVSLYWMEFTLIGGVCFDWRECIWIGGSVIGLDGVYGLDNLEMNKL